MSRLPLQLSYTLGKICAACLALHDVTHRDRETIDMRFLSRNAAVDKDLSIDMST